MPGQIPTLCIDKVLPGIIIKLNKRLQTKKYLSGENLTFLHIIQQQEIRQLTGGRQAVVRQASGSCQVIVMQLSGCHH